MYLVLVTLPLRMMIDVLLSVKTSNLRYNFPFFKGYTYVYKSSLWLVGNKRIGRPKGW